MKKKTALIFGITGQDGSLLARFLIKKGYVVHGIKRRSSSFNTGRIDDIYDNFSGKKKLFFLKLKLYCINNITWYYGSRRSQT